MTNTTERRENQLEAFDRLETKVDLIQDEVKELTRNLITDHEVHHAYLVKVLQREARREALHRAIIEKTLIALLWSALVGFGSLLYATIISHWK